MRLDYQPRSRKGPRHELLNQLVVVLFILALALGLFLLLSPKTGRGDAKVMAAQYDIAKIARAVGLFRHDVGRYLPTSEGLSILCDRTQTADLAWHGPYIASNMLEDPWGHRYEYRVQAGVNGWFEVVSCGPDGQLGTADDLTVRTPVK